MRTDKNGCSTCQIGQEQHEEIKTGSRYRSSASIAYDYRHTNGELFTTAAPTIHEARARRDNWLAKNGYDPAVITSETKENVIERLQFYQNKIERLEGEKKELIEALQLAESIIDRLCSDYSTVAGKHANHTVKEARIISSAIQKSTT